MHLLLVSPVLLAYLTGMVLALVFWRRCPTACLLVLVATGIHLIAQVGSFLSVYIVNLGTVHYRVELFQAIGLAVSVVHALAIGLLLAAVFVGRPTPPA